MRSSALSLYLPAPASPAAPVIRVEEAVPAGFPSPAEDYLEERIDLSRELIRNPAATFLARVRGESMRDAGLADGDLILIDRSLAARTGHLVLAWVDGGFTVKRLHLVGERCVLRSANPAFSDLELREGDDRIWGVVTHIIHACVSR